MGTALAWLLAERGVDRITVVDLDLAGVYASSELNAGGARATWWQPVNVETCRSTLAFFRENAERFAFRPRGYLWLYRDRELWDTALRKRSLQNALGLGVEIWDAAAVRARYPFLDRELDELVGATFSPGDGLVNPNAVRQWYRSRAEQLGVRFLNRHYINGVRTALTSGAGGVLRRIQAIEAVELPGGDPADESGVLRDLLTGHHLQEHHTVGTLSLPTELALNALGAWSPIFSAKVGVRDVTEPVRRQVSLVGLREGEGEGGGAPALDFASTGMIVDANGVYYHPEGSHILAGYSIPDEPPGYDFSYDGDAFFETQIWPRLAHRSSVFDRCGHIRGWAGLYATTPDRSGIAGPVGGFSNFWEAHSFTGRGVMQSYGVANNLAARIASGRWADVDLSPLRRERFADRSRWVQEPLHI